MLSDKRLEPFAPTPFYGVEGKWIPHLPGMFMYSGFGEGWYYSVDGYRYGGNSTEAREKAAEEGVEYGWVDSFAFTDGGSVDMPDWIRERIVSTREEAMTPEAQERAEKAAILERAKKNAADAVTKEINRLDKVDPDAPLNVLIAVALENIADNYIRGDRELDSYKNLRRRCRHRSSTPARRRRGDKIGTIYGVPHLHDSEANARRLCAAWNAVEGIPTEWLENADISSIVGNLQRTLEEVITALSTRRR